MAAFGFRDLVQDEEYLFNGFLPIFIDSDPLPTHVISRGAAFREVAHVNNLKVFFEKKYPNHDVEFVEVHNGEERIMDVSEAQQNFAAFLNALTKMKIVSRSEIIGGDPQVANEAVGGAGEDSNNTGESEVDQALFSSLQHNGTCRDSINDPENRS